MTVGSNPNIDVNLTSMLDNVYRRVFLSTIFLCEDATCATNIPTLSYGGNYFDVTIPSTSYFGSANDAADSTTIWLIRPGFTTQAMSMGQRIL
jgi:hypothetical protein